jgi:hypothetical protein
MSILSDYIDLVNETITDKTANYSITPQNVGNRLTELAELVPELALPVPLGTIIMYAPASTSEFDNSGLGVASNVSGWAICNGSNGTPDMRSKFVVGYNPSDADYNVIGETGGQKYVTQVLAHEHFLANTDTVPSGTPIISPSLYLSRHLGGAGNLDYYLSGTATNATVGKTSSTGVAQPDNRPPYFTVLYLKKIA